DGVSIPARDPNASPLLLDLTAFYNIAPESTRALIDSSFAVAAPLPLGIVTLDGVDYDMRGALEMRYDSGYGSVHSYGRGRGVALQSSVRGIPVPPVPIAALHVLMFASEAVPSSTERTYSIIRVHYRDGSDAVLPIRTQREVPGGTDHDRPVPVGWVFG